MAGAELARNDWNAMARNSIASTIPADVPSSRGAWLSDRPGWCVDTGSTLTALTTCELWLALARGEITPQMKVWREGMAHWESVAAVPEFALAMPDASVWAPAAAPAPNAPASAARVAAARVAAVVELRDPSILPAEAPFAPSEVVDGITYAPSGDFVTPAPVVVENRTAPPPASGVRSRPGALDRRSALSVAFGAAVAITALALATTGPARVSAANEKPLELTVTAATPSAPENSPPSAAPPAPARRGPRSMDRGQRRARVSGHDEIRAAAIATPPR